LYFPLYICAATTSTTDYCGDNVSFPELLLVMIEAHLAPCVLVIAVVMKKLAISDKVCPRPVFCMHRHDRIKKGQVRDEQTASWAVYLST